MGYRCQVMRMEASFLSFPSPTLRTNKTHTFKLCLPWKGRYSWVVPDKGHQDTLSGSGALRNAKISTDNDRGIFEVIEGRILAVKCSIFFFFSFQINCMPRTSPYSNVPLSLPPYLFIFDIHLGLWFLTWLFS